MSFLELLGIPESDLLLLSPISVFRGKNTSTFLPYVVFYHFSCYALKGYHWMAAECARTKSHELFSWCCHTNNLDNRCSACCSPVSTWYASPGVQQCRTVGSGHVRLFYFALLIVCFEQHRVALLAHPSLSLHAALLPVIQLPVDRFDFMTANLLPPYYSQIYFRFWRTILQQSFDSLSPRSTNKWW